MKRRVLLIGATGVFGRRLAAHVARWPEVELIATARSFPRALAIAAPLGARALAFERTRDLDQLSTIAPWAVIDASGPFQAADFALARAAIAAGAHMIDLADAREYLAAHPAALDDDARARGVAAIAGASSTPGLSCAVVAALTQFWRRIDTIDICIAPGGGAEVGPAVAAGVLSYAGADVPTWRFGGAAVAIGWALGPIVHPPGLTPRRGAVVDTLDPVLLGRRHGVRDRVSFHAALESAAQHHAIAVIGWLRRHGWIKRPEALAPWLHRLRGVARRFGSTRGAMMVDVAGLDAKGVSISARWSLRAEQGHGPHVPTLATAAVLRALLGGGVAPGARLADAVVTLADIEAEMAGYALTTARETWPLQRGLFESALGAAHAGLPAPLARFHAADGPRVWRGRATVSRGAGALARLIARVFRMPEAGTDVSVTVAVERHPNRDGAAPAETWTRNFAGREFNSVLSLRPGGVHEVFGPVAFDLNLAADPAGLTFALARCRVFGLPLPRFLAPRLSAREDLDPAGRFRFAIDLALPLIGPIVGYRGWLDPVKIPPARAP